MNLKYKITPQMKEYDNLGTIWLPYLMYFHAPNYSSNVINVDFFDTNEAISNMQLDGKWLYVDRAHLTDEGNYIVAKIVQEKVI